MSATGHWHVSGSIVKDQVIVYLERKLQVIHMCMYQFGLTTNSIEIK